MKKDFVVKDSGKREIVAETGMQRDIREDKGRFDLISLVALFRIARVYEKGAKKYNPRNWEKGGPYSRFCDSAVRHIVEFMLGMDDEDHLGQAAWNLMCIMELEVTHPEMNDLPYRKEENHEKMKAVLEFLKLLESETI
jgi:hypothetical protein